MRGLLLFVLSAGCTFGQTPELQYTGKPLKLGAQCTAENVRAADLSCSFEEPCALFLELADAEAVGNRIVLSGNLHTAAQTLASILLISEDLGKTWKEPFARLPGAVLDRIQFFDFEQGWISGHILERQPRDAFFVISSDGGRTWHKRTIYGEPRAGAIELFWFDSRGHGTMLFDKGQGGENGMRHELYESMTGGESWNIRQVDSKPIPVSRPVAPSKSWRIRADAKLQAYVVERHGEGRWQTMASFSVAASECKPAEPAAVEEPTSPPEVAAPPTPAQPKAEPLRRPPSLKKKNGG